LSTDLLEVSCDCRGSQEASGDVEYVRLIPRSSECSPLRPSKFASFSPSTILNDFVFPDDLVFSLLVYRLSQRKAHRNKNQFLLDMNRLVQEASTDYESRREILEQLRYDYSQYFLGNVNRYLKFDVYSGGVLKGSYFSPYKFRGSKAYQKKTVWKLNHLSFNVDLKPYFLTLTVDFKAFSDIKAGSVDLSRRFNSLITGLRNLDHDIQYLRVSEIQLKNTMNVHFHILLYSNLDLDIIQKHLETYHLSGSQNDLKDLSYEFKKRNNRDPKRSDLSKYVRAYILKYLKKGISSDKPLENDNLIVLMALGSRSFSHSRNLKVLVDKNKNSSQVDFNSESPLFFSLASYKVSFLDFLKNNSNGNITYKFGGIFYDFEFPVSVYPYTFYSTASLMFNEKEYVIELVGKPLKPVFKNT